MGLSTSKRSFIVDLLGARMHTHNLPTAEIGSGRSRYGGSSPVPLGTAPRPYRSTPRARTTAQFEAAQCLTTENPSQLGLCYNDPLPWDLEVVQDSPNPITASQRAVRTCEVCPLFATCRAQALSRAEAGAPPLAVIEGGIVWGTTGAMLAPTDGPAATKRLMSVATTGRSATSRGRGRSQRSSEAAVMSERAS